MTFEQQMFTSRTMTCFICLSHSGGYQNQCLYFQSQDLGFTNKRNKIYRQ